MGEPVVTASTLKLGVTPAGTWTIVPLARLVTTVVDPPRINLRPMTRPVWAFVSPQQESNKRVVAMDAAAAEVPRNIFMMAIRL
jgi:hypothetical protein